MKKISLICASALALCAMSCTKKNSTPDTPNGKPEITVAKENLVLYLPFESEAIGAGDVTLNTKGATTEANFKEGRTGKAFTGGENQYLLYDIPAESPLRTIKGYTLSAWIKQNEIPQSQDAVPMFFQIAQLDKESPDYFWGNLTLSIDRTAEGAGYLTYKTVGRFDGGNLWKTWNGDYGECYPAGRWNHLIFIYDNTVSEYHVYVNGTDVTPESAVACKNGENPVGDLVFKGADQFVVGAWMTRLAAGATDAWMGWLDGGAIDELRLYNRALTATEVAELYKCEIANINE